MSVDLFARAQKFVDVGDEAQADILHDCMIDGSVKALCAVQLLFEDMYGGHTYNIQIKGPAAYCLVRWGKAGLTALVEGARRTPKSKNRSIAIETLSSLASGEQQTYFARFADQRLIADVQSLCSEWNTIASDARLLLTKFVLEMPADDLTLAIGHQFTAYSMVTSPAAIREVFEAFALRLVAVGEPVLEAFERLLTSSAGNEPAFQKFLTEHPQMLDPMAVQVWPQPSLWGAREPDFVVRRADDTYLVVEIECPKKLLLTATGQLSAESSHAVHQVLDYADRLVQRQEILGTVFPRFRAPDCLVINGMEASLTADQKRMLTLENAHRRGVRIAGFDWLTSRARAIMTGYVGHRVQVSTATLT